MENRKNNSISLGEGYQVYIKRNKDKELLFYLIKPNGLEACIPLHYIKDKIKDKKIKSNMYDSAEILLSSSKYEKNQTQQAKADLLGIIKKIIICPK